MSQPTIRVEGIRELQRYLRTLEDKTLPRGLRKVGKDAADIVAKEASRRVPVRSGRLRSSIRAAGQQRGGLVRAGGARTRYAGWIEFGGAHRVRGGGRANRAFVREGRYIRPSARSKEKQVVATYERGINQLLRKQR